MDVKDAERLELLEKVSNLWETLPVLASSPWRLANLFIFV
jgi:hypothetical protein